MCPCAEGIALIRDESFRQPFNHLEFFMTQLRLPRLAGVLLAFSALTACNVPPRMGMAMGHGASGSMATPDHMAKMDAQMKSMQAMHEKMMSAKTPAERNSLMAEHMKSMQGGMAMMDGMGGMGGMQGAPATPGSAAAPGMGSEMGGHHQMMEKRMQMMQTMMKMMMDRMPPPPAK
jgi:hypothetical protein